MFTLQKNLPFKKESNFTLSKAGEYSNNGVS